MRQDGADCIGSVTSSEMSLTSVGADFGFYNSRRQKKDEYDAVIAFA